jgi:predicted permease
MIDLRFAIRQLLKSPGFSALAIITLAIGIGMNTAIFSLINDLFLNALPYEQPERLIHIYQQEKTRKIDKGPTSVPKFWHYRDAQTVFSEFAADGGTGGPGFILTGMGEPQQINGNNVTANYFSVLGVKPILGRLFQAEEEMKADVIVISEHFWKSKLAGDPNVLGRSLTLSGVPRTIIGVIPTQPIAWLGASDVEIFTSKPFELAGISQQLLMRGTSFLRPIGRLKPGVTLEQAKANVAAVAQSYRAANAEKGDASWEPALVPMPEDVTGQLRPAFITLLAAVAVVLLIACSNVANLLLVRFTVRKREIALRVALGASRSSIVRLFVLESTLLSVIAGTLGIFLALWALPLIPKLAGDNLALGISGELNLPVLAFTIAVSLLTGFLMGGYPALQSSKSDLVHGLKEGGRGTAGSVAQQRFGRVLVGAQVCLSVVLLAGAALLVTSFMRLAQENAGYRIDRIWNGRIALPPARYPDRAAYVRFAKGLEDELRTTAGVEMVAISNAGVPLGGAYPNTPYSRADGNIVPPNERPFGLFHIISPGYFRLFGIPLIAGREFDERDNNLDSPPVVIISRATAQRLFPGQDPVGRQLYFGTESGTGQLVQIVGVVGDIRFRALDKTDDVEFYQPIAPRSAPSVVVTIRSALRPEAAAGTVRAVLSKMDPELAITQPSTMEELFFKSLGQQRLTTTLLGVFAGVAFLLATIGIYGAVAYTVAQRTGEIGVRMALGAQTADVLRMIVRQGMAPVVIGLLVGIGSALALGRFLTTQLYQVSPHNPVVLATTASLLAVVALIACLVPARRATLVDPIQALRTE